MPDDIIVGSNLGLFLGTLGETPLLKREKGVTALGISRDDIKAAINCVDGMAFLGVGY